MDKACTTAFEILRKIRAEGFTAYFAGGAVRDRLMGRIPKDYDIATSALPEQIEALFPKTVAVGKAFGVIMVVQDGFEIEVATFREDAGYQDGRRPDSVHFCGAEEDAKRRDFTVNGMFWDPVADEVIDYVGGREDLEKRLIRAIGDPERRFAEDHLRMLRAVRFAHTLGFRIDPATYSAIKAQAPDLAKISIERIENEFSRILTESLRPGDALRELVELGLMKHIIPEVLPMIGQEQPPQFHPEGDVFEHTCLMLNLMNRQAGKPASQTVEQTFQSAHSPSNCGQAGKPASQTVEQTFQSAHPFRPVQQEESLQQSRRRLPHWQQNNRIYFVTFRLADSIAQEKLEQWKEEVSHLCETKRTAEYRRKYEEWSDKGHGSCILKNQTAADIVAETLRHFDGERYQLGSYVIMPNHVHLIVAPAEENSLSDILHSWKGFSAWKINKTLATNGPVWMDESFDHIIRSENAFREYSNYIDQNPTKAGLLPSEFRLGAGSLKRTEQAGKPASQPVEQTFQSAHSPSNCGQAGKPASQPVEQTFQSARPPNFKKLLAYTVLLHDVGKPDTAFMGEDRIRFHGHETLSAKMAEEILRRLHLPVKEIRQIVTAIAGHMRFKDVQKMNKSTLRKLMGAETFDLEMELHRADCEGSHGLLDNYDFLLKKAEEMANEPVLPKRWVTGRDLCELGVEPGPRIGELLQEAYDAQLEGRFRDRAELLEWLKKRL